MEFKMFFLKEGSRLFDQPDLITLLTSNRNIISPNPNENVGKKVYLYHHDILNFEAQFVISNKSVVPHIESIDPRYYDVNFYVSFDVLLSNYAVSMLLDIVQEICIRYGFKIYIESFGIDVKPFRRSDVMQTFTVWKRSFAEKYPEKVANYKRLDSQTFGQVYSYLQSKKRLELTNFSDKVQISNYYFFHTDRSRSAFVAIKWDGERPFVLPPAVDILILDDGHIVKQVPMTQVLSKTEKMFKPIDGKGEIQLLDTKYVNKLHKFLVKEKFAPPNFELHDLSLDNILDV